MARGLVIILYLPGSPSLRAVCLCLSRFFFFFYCSFICFLHTTKRITNPILRHHLCPSNMHLAYEPISANQEENH
ncbi:hypothetical protein EUTSA_v10009253mg [Eutrema salsugineum]|uniref:Uncharacterized protein n=1 Tax=Eutrema salsugineum TaxID=72664 RepID=V4KXU2_EUTSA|nr:hypothetical protein EUTSA_v10009253mg [Eutrema salsugineum]